MKTIIGLSSVAILPVLVSTTLYLLEQKTAWGKLSKNTKQIIYGIIFGGLAVIGNEFGVDLGGAIANTRDASVLTAGLIFGAPAGIIAGVIGSVERFLCVYWGGGAYTRLACSLSTLFAALFGAVLRKHMFDDKKPTVSYGLGIGLVAEVAHMLMIFITNMSDIATAFGFVKKCAIPMITVNGLAVMLSVLAVTLLGKEKMLHRHRSRQIGVVAQQWLLNCVIAAFLVTCTFTAVLQYRITENNINELLQLNIDDVVADISDASDRNLLALTERVAAELANGGELDEIAARNNITDINLVAENGYIIDSTNPDFLFYNMHSGAQSSEFLVLLEGTDSFVQSYQPISYDTSISRKYAGVALPEGGFLQVGYDAEHFQADIDRQVTDAAFNRHIGQNGYLFIADEARNVISTRRDMMNSTNDGDIVFDGEAREGERFTASFYGEEVYGMYRFSEGYYIIGVMPSSEANFNRELSIYMTAFIEIIIFVALFIVVYFLIKKLVVDNIKSVNYSLAEITGGNLNVMVNVRSSEEFASLSDDINATVDTLKHYIAEAAARLDRELELAKVIQDSSLPSTFPPFPEKEELDLYALMDAAREVGGDFYDFYLLDEDHLAFLVADVSGKGITGALFMMKAKALIQNFAEQGGDVAEILTRANGALCEGNEAEMFVTCFMCILDLKNGTMEYANAGHNPPLLRRRNGSFEFFKSRPGFVLGGMEGIQYRKGETTFQPGDTLFLYTDGVTEATDSDNKLYGNDRLHRTLNDAGNRTARELCDAVAADLALFVGEAPQFDDITMLCLRLLPTKGEEMTPSVKEITVEATVENIQVVTDFVGAELEAMDCSIRAQTQLNIAMDELLSNIANYAYAPDTGKVTVRLWEEPETRSVVLSFIDSGIPYDPLQRPDPNTKQLVQEREIGGLGILLVKKSMDDVSYEYRDGQNILKIKKNL